MGDAEVNFPPVGAAGATIAAIRLRFVPDVSWLLPAMWQMLCWHSAVLLPPASCHAKWQLAAPVFRCRCRVLMDAGQARMLAPWRRAVWCQLLLAAIIHVRFGGDDELTSTSSRILRKRARLGRV
jgi:hypothetical protein